MAMAPIRMIQRALMRTSGAAARPDDGPANSWTAQSPRPAGCEHGAVIGRGIGGIDADGIHGVDHGQHALDLGPSVIWSRISPPGPHEWNRGDRFAGVGRADDGDFRSDDEASFVRAQWGCDLAHSVVSAARPAMKRRSSKRFRGAGQRKTLAISSEGRASRCIWSQRH